VADLSGRYRHLPNIYSVLSVARNLCQKKSSSKKRGSVMNQMALRMRKAGSSMLSPSCLIDRFLDWVEQHGNAILAPARLDNLPARETPIETRLDQSMA
jgi:hypothetical protein